MNKLPRNYLLTEFIIILSLGALVFHIIQVHSFFVSVGDISIEDTHKRLLVKPAPIERITTVLFLGDVMLGRHVEYLSELNGVKYTTSQLVDQLPEADAVVANFESAIALPHTRTKAYTTQFSTALWMLPILEALNVTHVSLANNHSLDFGNTGFQNAVRELEAVGMVSFGHGNQVSSSSLAVIEGDTRIGIIAVNTIFMDVAESDLAIELETLNNTTDVQVAYIHWGDEYESVHNDAQEALARRLVALGVDVIVGHHPHVVQDIAIVDGALVFYSLGNFIFDQYFSKEVQEGYALTMHVDARQQLFFSIIPTTSIDVRSQPRLMTATETALFLEGLARRSDSSIADHILENNLRGLPNLASEG